MRKLPIIALVVCIMAAVAGSAFADDVYTKTFSAGINFTSTGAFTCVASLVNLDGTAAAGSNLDWDAAIDLNASPKPSWVMAAKAIKIESTISKLGGIEIYTDNTASDASPKFMGDVSIYGTTAGGLVCEEDPTASPLPLCWRVLDAPTTTFAPQHGATAAQTADGKNYPDRLWDNSTGPNYPCYLWMEDKSGHADRGDGVWRPTWDPSYDDPATAANEYADVKSYRIIKDERGIQHAEAGFLPGISSPDYVYIGANFANAITPRTYRTSKIIINAYTE